MYRFLFTDDEFFMKEVYADSWRGALLQARSRFQIKGRLYKFAEYSNVKEYRLAGGYSFMLRQCDP